MKVVVIGSGWAGCEAQTLRQVIERAAIRRQEQIAAASREAWISRKVERISGGSLCRDALHRV